VLFHRAGADAKAIGYLVIFQIVQAMHQKDFSRPTKC